MKVLAHHREFNIVTSYEVDMENNQWISAKRCCGTDGRRTGWEGPAFCMYQKSREESISPLQSNQKTLKSGRAKLNCVLYSKLGCNTHGKAQRYEDEKF